ncbi:hypothetical protein H4R18_003703, partial [Coemansia javaensis]
MGNGLSFANAAVEQERVEAAARLLGARLDPRGPGDATVIMVLAAAYAVTCAGAAYMAWHRDYPPIRSKSPLLLAGITVCAVLWFVGGLPSDGHVGLRGTAFENCKAFGMWMRIICGVSSLCGLWAARAYGQFRAFRLGKPFRGRGVYIPLLVFAICLLAFGTVVQVLSPERSLHYVEPLDLCVISSWTSMVVLSINWTIWAAVAALGWMCRNVKTSFREGRETALGCVCVCVVLVSITVVKFAAPRYPLSLRLRILVTAVDHSATNLYLWLIMAKPVLNCIFRRDCYLDQWVGKLVEDGLQLQYAMACDDDDQHNVTTMYLTCSSRTA